MLLKKISVENVRSFLDRQELLLDSLITIIIGPNGGGKTNLLDTIVTVLRRYLFASMYPAAAPTQEQAVRFEFRHNDLLNSMNLARHSSGAGRDQLIEVDLEITEQDLENMRAMQVDAPRIMTLASSKYFNLKLTETKNWNLASISPGTRVTYRIVNEVLRPEPDDVHKWFLQYLNWFEVDSYLRQEFEISPLTNPLIYLPVNRSANGFQSTVALANYEDFEVKRQSDATSSRSGTQIVTLAIGRLAQKYRLLLEKDTGTAAREFREDPNLKQLSQLLKDLGYEWELETVNPLKNQYDIRLKKQGSSFLVSEASSGERELLTYLFAIFALNIRDALLIVDEPELHLHPKWQKTLLDLFMRLSSSTRNQFLLATHSPIFVSPESIQYVSRVYSRDQRSNIVRLKTSSLPGAKHLLSIVNSHNNERLFFADDIVLVEGISDRIFIEAALDKLGRSESSGNIVEVISVGGKGLFEAYRNILDSCDIRYSTIADLDYVKQIGTNGIKTLFSTDADAIKSNVIDSAESLDGTKLVQKIDDAMRTGGWEEASDLWGYIKSRHIKLISNISASEAKELSDFIESPMRFARWARSPFLAALNF